MIGLAATTGQLDRAFQGVRGTEIRGGQGQFLEATERGTWRVLVVLRPSHLSAEGGFWREKKSRKRVVPMKLWLNLESFTRNGFKTCFSPSEDLEWGVSGGWHHSRALRAAAGCLSNLLEGPLLHFPAHTATPSKW